MHVVARDPAAWRSKTPPADVLLETPARSSLRGTGAFKAKPLWWFQLRTTNGAHTGEPKPCKVAVGLSSRDFPVERKLAAGAARCSKQWLEGILRSIGGRELAARARVLGRAGD